MDTSFVFYAQIASVVVFLSSLFALYRLLASAKDATITLLKEKVAFLEAQLSEMRRQAPDVLAQTLADRVRHLQAELERLVADKTVASSRIVETEEQLARAQGELNDYKQRVESVRKILETFGKTVESYVRPQENRVAGPPSGTHA